MSLLEHCPLSSLLSGQHLDRDRPSGARQSPPSIPGKVQICSQVRAVYLSEWKYVSQSQLEENESTTWLLHVLIPHSHHHQPVAFLSRAIVFVVDSAIFQKEVRDVAEFLYILLTDTVICRNAPALLVACNKQGAVKKSPITYMLPLCINFQPKPDGAYRIITHWFV